MKHVLAFLPSGYDKNSCVPHASKELNQTAIAKGQGDDDAGVAEAKCAEIDQAEDESGEGESRETERRWVGELATLDRLV